MTPREGSGLRVSGAPWKGWWATLLVVATISGVLSYSPPSRADTGCTLTASRAQQLEDGLLASSRATGWKWFGSVFIVGGALVAIAGILSAQPELVVGGIWAASAGFAAAWVGGNPPPSSQAPQTSCEKAFAALPDAQRKQVIALLDKGDTSGAMALLDPPSVALPPNWIHLGLSAPGFGGSRVESTGVAATGQSPTAGQSSGGGQTR